MLNERANGTIETRQNLRATLRKAAKRIAKEDPKREGLRRQDWRKVLGK